MRNPDSLSLTRARAAVSATNGFDLAGAVRTRMDETDEEMLPVAENGLALDLAAKEIVTLRLKLAGGRAGE